MRHISATDIGLQNSAEDEREVFRGRDGVVADVVWIEDCGAGEYLGVEEGKGAPGRGHGLRVVVVVSGG